MHFFAFLNKLYITKHSLWYRIINESINYHNKYSINTSVIFKIHSSPCVYREARQLLSTLIIDLLPPLPSTGPGLVPFTAIWYVLQRCKGIFVWLLAKHNSVNKLLREKSRIVYHRASTFKIHCVLSIQNWKQTQQVYFEPQENMVFWILSSTVLSAITSVCS